MRNLNFQTRAALKEYCVVIFMLHVMYVFMCVSLGA